MITLKALSKNWVFEAFREAWKQPGFKRKAKHLKYRLLWELRPMLKIAGSYPLAVDIEAHSACNYRCVFCQKTDDNYWKTQKEDEINWDKFCGVVDECADIGVYSMKLNWRGEPLLNNRIPDMIFYMKQRGIHEVMMNTNGSKLTPENTDLIIISGIDRIIFSCDGITKDTYNKIRRGGDWDVFFEKVKYFSERCKYFKARGMSVPIIRINTAIMEENLHEIPSFKDKFSGIIDELRFNTVYNPQSKNKYLGGRKRKVKRKGCPQIYQRMIISCEGNGIPCCADYKQQLNLGNVENLTIKKMYNDEMDKIRNQHESHRGRSLPGCSGCDLFQLSGLNEKKEVVWS